MNFLTQEDALLNEARLSQHFTLGEFIRSATANKLSIDNTAPLEVLTNLKRLAQCCEQIRMELDGAPMMISSGYRCPDLNKAVGGSTISRHLMGLACDFTAPQFGTPLAICKKLAKSRIEFDQLILEFSARANWVHFGIAAAGQQPRRQVLTINNKRTTMGLLMDEKKTHG